MAPLGEIAGSGAIQHLWMTAFPKWWRSLVLRIYDIGSVAFWYRSEPHVPFPALPDGDSLEVISDEPSPAGMTCRAQVVDKVL